ncbi:hypothetical protein KUV57_11520 [Epibacterium sp. DP7N7-1]|nr:hypothetical protein [Epibacterium sp. DP7N7-1]
MPHVPYGQEPERIDISPDVYAIKIGLYYHITFPYSQEAVNIMRKVATAHFSPEMKGWAARGSRHEDIREALGEISKTLNANRNAVSRQRDTYAAKSRSKPDKPVKPQRVLVPIEDGLRAGDVLELKKKHITVERLGTPFTADSRYARWGKPEMVGSLVRYAYYRPSTEAEIEELKKEQLESQKGASLPDQDTDDQFTP